MSGRPSFEPSRLTLRAGVPARLTFTRTSEKTCATSVVVASLKIKKELPLNEPVSIGFTPSRAGEIAFACGMNMLRGTLVSIDYLGGSGGSDPQGSARLPALHVMARVQVRPDTGRFAS
ncbi:MAG: cupredoxin domain-containing protein [Vicinamibacterales bacterium]